jgi:hypothetical protein
MGWIKSREGTPDSLSRPAVVGEVIRLGGVSMSQIVRLGLAGLAALLWLGCSDDSSGPNPPVPPNLKAWTNCRN